MKIKGKLSGDRVFYTFDYYNMFDVSSMMKDLEHLTGEKVVNGGCFMDTVTVWHYNKNLADVQYDIELKPYTSRY